LRQLKEDWIKENHWKGIFASTALMYPSQAFAIEHSDVIKAINKYEWENPIMPGDIMMGAFAITVLLTFGYIFIDVMQSEKNFADIIDIINESLVISGSDDKSSSLYLNQ
jgi:hypothetical protein